MSLLFLIIDLIIANNTAFNSYFLIITIPFLNKNNVFYLIIAALFLDLFCFFSFPVNLICLIALYYLNQFIYKKYKPSFISISILSLVNYLIYIFLSSFFTQYQNIEISYLLLYLIKYSWINIILYIISYNFLKKRIKFTR